MENRTLISFVRDPIVNELYLSYLITVPRMKMSYPAEALSTIAKHANN